ncbi:MAG: MarR family transcriptional regulator [Gemmatimonadaceae bacterium]|nr:MarR family transcriptional regulator [Gemmatimonadaceae bacterium]
MTTTRREPAARRRLATRHASPSPRAQQPLPLASTREESFLSLLRTAAVMRRPVARVLEDHGLSMAQYNVLRILRGAGDVGLPTLDIRDRMIEEAAGITRLIDKLERAGFVKRVRGSSTDRRQVYCRASVEGLTLLATLDPLVALAMEASLAMLAEPDLHRLVDVLDRVRHEAPRVASASDRRAAGGEID